MESIGEKLRHAREHKNLSVEQVARDTHISKRYIAALEVEEFGGFPAESYTVGFLRSYAQYLGLDPDEITGLYKNLKIQESPAPINQLLYPPTPRRSRLAIVVVAVLVLAGAGVTAFLFFTDRLGGDRLLSEAERNARPTTSAHTPVASETGRMIDLTDEFVEQRFSIGDTVRVLRREELFPVTVVAIGDAVVVEFAAGQAPLAVGIAELLDLDGDEQPDVRVLVRSIEDAQDDSNGELSATIRFDRAIRTEVASPSVDADSTEGAVTDSNRVTNQPARVRETRSLGDFAPGRPIVFNATFIGTSLVRIRTDGQPPVEQVYDAGQVLQGQADSVVRLWVANAGALQMTVAGKSVGLGLQGQVRVWEFGYSVIPGSTRLRLDMRPVY